MTVTEAEINRLMEERDFLRTIVSTRKYSKWRRCVYCGRFGYGLACHQHKHILRVDPHFTAARHTG